MGMSEQETKAVQSKALIQMKVIRYLATVFTIAVVGFCIYQHNWLGAIVGALAVGWQFGWSFGLDKGTKIVYAQWEKSIGLIPEEENIKPKRKVFEPTFPPRTQKEIEEMVKEASEEAAKRTEALINKRNC